VQSVARRSLRELEESKSGGGGGGGEPEKPVPVTQSKQFLQLKSMLDKKNVQLMDVRRRLAKYEPDEGDAADDEPSGK
jgi:hypothetical protein